MPLYLDIVIQLAQGQQYFLHYNMVILSNNSTNASTQLIDDVCKKTINNAECLKILESNPQALSASSYKDLAQAALGLAIANAEHSQTFINNLVKSDPKDAIKECASLYQAVVASFKSSKVEIEEDPMTANYDAKIAGDDAGNCETALSSKGVKVPEISVRNHVAQLYSSIGDVATALLD
ncbi:uncharacterized protein Pyn_05862 [Prunus yedoensis var. nudiflora]|uniref:Pectinesterase inhibitor domain-containing protein n=1 Tax=Prunus yedoensis var. nudiflora TaxID=2094558 RepID=A0A314UFV5_PRUYE|nr:uncharacterized protein Pyn_05862 [Prunus yedoensis var. nudiflora]